MKKFFTYLLVLVASSLLACTEPYDDTAIRSDIEDLKERVTKLEELCNQMNTNIDALQTIVAALQNNDYVTKVEPVTENGTIIGYKIYFTKSNPVTIYHGKDGANGTDGKDGQNGYIPVIGVKQDTDGIYYWTLDGEWLLDENGNKVKAVGTDGKDGQNGANGNDGATGPQGEQGVTPLLKIENDYWYISYDNGKSWTELGKATGDKGDKGDKGDVGLVGDSMFTDVDYSNKDYVVFTLSNGTQVKVPTWYAFEQLQTLCNQMNTNISALQTIVAALQNNDYVTKVEPVVENGTTIGYTIYLTKSNPVTIYHGQNGKDGYTPIVGVKQDVDGIYYWTIDGEWLLDESGSKVKAVGTDGKDGQNGANGNDGVTGPQGPQGEQGITPQLKIEGGNWFISYDNGTTWKKVGQATGDAGKDGDVFFQGVTQDEQFVHFTLADGTVITLPKGASLDIAFAEGDLVVMSPNSARTIRYSVQSVTENVTVEVTSSSDIRAKTVADDATGKSGRIEIKSGAALDEYSKVIVFVSNGEKVIMKSISFEQASLEISNGVEQKISAEGGCISLNFLTNISWEVYIPNSAQSWISLAPRTRAMAPYTAVLNIAPNTTLSERSAIVDIKSQDGKLSISYTIWQGVFDNVMITTHNEVGWKSGDTISVFAANTINQSYTYNGIDGATTGVFLAPALEDSTQEYMNGYYAVYPYKANYSLSAEGTLTIPFPATQNYVAGGYATDLNTMVAVSSSATDKNLSLQPVCAYLCVKLWGKDHNVKSITLTSKGGEALSGNGVVAPHYNAVPTCVLSGSANSIKLNCGEVKVGTSEAAATELWFVVPPVALQQGYTLKVVEFYGGEQTIEQEATTFVSGTTYNVTAELTIASDGPGMGVGGWGDGDNIGGEI